MSILQLSSVKVLTYRKTWPEIKKFKKSILKKHNSIRIH